jgi:hypothetical protein
MNDIIKASLFGNLNAIVCCAIVSVLSSALIIASSNISADNPEYYNFSVICTVIIASSITFLSFSDGIGSGWYSFLVSSENDRTGLIGSMLLVFCINILISAGLTAAILAVYDQNIIDTVSSTLMLALLICDLLFCVALLVYSSTGSRSAFSVTLPALAIMGCILTYISIIEPDAGQPGLVGILATLIVSAVMIALSFRMIRRTDLRTEGCHEWEHRETDHMHRHGHRTDRHALRSIIHPW